MVGVNIIPEYYPWPWRQHMLGHALSSTWEEVLHRANTPSASLASLAIWLLWYHFRGLGALLVPSTTVLVCDALIWERRFLFLIQLHLCLASFDFSLHPFHPTSPIPPPLAAVAQAVWLQRFRIGRHVWAQQFPCQAVICALERQRLMGSGDRERGGDKEEDWEWDKGEEALNNEDKHSLKGCWFIWLALSYGRNLQQNGWRVTFECAYRAAVGGCSVGSEIKCGNSCSGLLRFRWNGGGLIALWQHSHVNWCSSSSSHGADEFLHYYCTSDLAGRESHWRVLTRAEYQGQTLASLIRGRVVSLSLSVPLAHSQELTLEDLLLKVLIKTTHLFKFNSTCQCDKQFPGW